MALSSSESELLTKTCTNMNVAANTCREVLEMLRSLGNTGVVDIATHNNASAAHENASNLAQQDSNHGIHNGTLGITDLFSGFYPLEINGVPVSPHMFLIAQTKGATGGAGYVNIYKVLSNSSEQAIEYDGASSALGSLSNLIIATYGGVLSGLDNGVRKDLGTRFTFLAGTYNHSGDFKYSFSRLELANNGTTSGHYDFTPDAFMPVSGKTISIGSSGLPWDTAYFRTAATVTSDRREKSNVSELDMKAVDFLKALRPVQFSVKIGKQNTLEADETGTPTSIETIPGSRPHWGLIAQEVKEALSTAGYEDAAVWCLADKDDPDSKQSLRYEELIAPLVKVVQVLAAKVEALEAR